ncbi:hypothetical protein OSB04_006721 [Centaurea solstitialis]|uniref:RNase H type-1 domain-containing protein n=1 Tax=Centaurea solstitialis TaxID=347529 RepID=A0AA38WSV0_9ASTR|nr:hypothetical protein OSB04_006721 [Centaurea solstitialis]
MNTRLRMLEEHNAKMLSLLAKLPGAAVPVEVEPKTGYQASPYFASSRKMKKQTSDLYYVVQKIGESIHDYFNRFNAEMSEIRNCDVKTAIKAYKRGLDDTSGIYTDLTKYPLENFDDVRTTKELVDSLRNIEANIRWPKKSEQPSKDKDQMKWCDFHGDHGHATEECICLKKELAYLKSKSHLKSVLPDGERPLSPIHTKVMNCITDCFAWSHEDMVRVSPDVISHKLNVDPSFKPIKQKCRKFTPERNKVINDEVDSLLKTSKIREVKYPDWLANVVVMQKKNEKWRVCIDFTDLNKVCPKDPFPLPHIDGMIDATTGHELLTFMDAYSGYNQILMHKGDQEKTTFMTDKGIYCYKVMPFGLKNAGSTYQRLVNIMFKEHPRRTMEMKLNPTKCSFRVGAEKFLGYMVTRRGKEAIPEQIKAIIELKSPKNMKEQYIMSPPLLTKPQIGKTLQLYLALSTSAVSAILVREEDNEQRPIYYISKSLLDAETSPELEPMTQTEVSIVAIQDDTPWIMHIDGSSNIRGSGLGVVLRSLQGGKMVYSIQCDFKTTNNEAEYEALITGMDMAYSLGAQNLHVRSDSLLVVNQVNGDFQSKDSKMLRYLEIAKAKIARFERFTIEQIPRDLNTQADALANLGFAFDEPALENVSIVHLTTPSIGTQEIV